MDGKKNGLGLQNYADGASFEGQFNFNTKEGLGVYTRSDGISFRGLW
jgi:MORN repeat